MKRILMVGCGDIALRVAGLLRASGHEAAAPYRLLGLVRSIARHEILRQAGILPVPGNLDDRQSLVRLGGLADIVLHFAPPPGAGDPVSDTRTRNLLSALSRGALPRQIIYISTSGVYGDCGGAQVSETHPINPQTSRAKLRISAEQQIRSWARRNGVQAVILRVPGIYAADRLPLDRLRAGSPAILAEQDSHTNHIHADDLARCVVAALQHGKPNRVIHTSDDSHLKMGEYFDVVADAHGLPRPPRLPRAQVERSVSPMMWSFMNESRQLTNERMKKELKVKLRYPTVADTLAAI